MRLRPKVLLPILAFAALAVIACVAVVASRFGVKNDDLIKSVIVPLLGPTVALLVPTWLFFVLPSRKDQRESAQKAIEYYFSEYVRGARLDGWEYLVTSVHSDLDKKSQQMKDYVGYVATKKANTQVPAETQAIYQKISLVLDFFSVLEGLIEEDAIDQKMLRKSLVYYYHWWRDEVLDPLRKHLKEEPATTDGKYVPLWMAPMSNLDRLIREQSEHLSKHNLTLRR